jgi:hypothetical protein
MVAAAVVVGAASVAGGAISASGARSAGRAQADAAKQAAQLDKEMYYDQAARMEPFRQAGLTTQTELMRQLGLSGDANSAGYGNLLKNFSQQDFQEDPGYGFRLKEGLKAIDRTAAARGNMISGAAMKAAERYGQDMASQEYQNAYNRYNNDRSTNYQMLTGQQSVGQNASNAMNQASGQYAQNAGDAYMQAGNARASGYVGAANAWSGALNNMSNMYMMNKFYG